MDEKMEQKIRNIDREDYANLVNFYLRNLFTIKELKAIYHAYGINSKNIPTLLDENLLNFYFEKELIEKVNKHKNTIVKINKIVNCLKESDLLKICRYPVIRVNNDEKKLLFYAATIIQLNGDLEKVTEVLKLTAQNIIISLKKPFLKTVMNETYYNMIMQYLMIYDFKYCAGRDEKKTLFLKVYYELEKRNFDLKKLSIFDNLSMTQIVSILSIPQARIWLSSEQQEQLKNVLEKNGKISNHIDLPEDILQPGYDAIENRHDLQLGILLSSFIFGLSRQQLCERYEKKESEIEEILSKENIRSFFNNGEVVNEILDKTSCEINDQNFSPSISEQFFPEIFAFIQQLEKNAMIAEQPIKEKIMKTLNDWRIILITLQRSGFYNNSFVELKISKNEVWNALFPENLKQYLPVNILKQYYSYLQEKRMDYQENPYFRFQELNLLKQKKLLYSLLLENGGNIDKIKNKFSISYVMITKCLNDKTFNIQNAEEVEKLANEFFAMKKELGRQHFQKPKDSINVTEGYVKEFYIKRQSLKRYIK